MALNTIKTYPISTGVRDYQVTFEYLSRAFVKVALLSTTGGRKQLTVSTDYVWTSPTNIQTVAALDTTGYDLVEIRRETPTTTRIITFQDGSILRAGDLNKSELQTMHIAEEARDVASSSVQLNTDNNYDTLNRRIVNVADGVDPTDAVNKKQLDDYAVSAQGFVTQAAQSAAAALVSQGAASRSEQNALGYENQADVAQRAAATSEKNADDSEAEAKAAALAAQQSNGLANQANSDAQAAKTAAAASKQAAALAESNAKDWEAKAAADAARAKTEADRAKQEADKIAAQNVLTNAINAVGAAPGYVVDFKSMPQVNGVDITNSLQGQGFQVNSNLTCDDGTNDDLRDNKFSGHSFMVAKPKTVNANGTTSNQAPAGMEYDWAVCNDFYGTWTPTGGTSGKTRVQTIYDKNAIWVRGYHHQDSTWTPWKRANNQFYTNVTGMNVETIVENGSYYYFPTGTTNVPVIDSPEDSDVYFLEVNSSDDAKQVVQTVASPKTNSNFTRYCVNGTWSRWWNTTATLDVDTAESGFDYNTTTNPGYWGINNATALNAPTEVGSEVSILQVFGTADGTTVQTVFCPAKGVSIFRMKDTSNTWGAWFKPIVTSASSSRITVSGIDGLSGSPLTLGADGAGDYDAVTMRQLKASQGNTGATMNGVATDFIGAVQWFQGTRANLPAGYLPADGGEFKRSDYPELWNAIDKGILVSIDDTGWWNTAPTGIQSLHRGKYSSGDGSTTFRVPDLNGMQTGSFNRIFLAGSNGKSTDWANDAPVGIVVPQTAPNITGGFVTKVPDGHSSKRKGVFIGSNGAQVSAGLEPAKYTSILGSGDAIDVANYGFYFDASRADGGSPIYGKLGQNVLAPNHVGGIWIIRAAGSFHASDTTFSVIDGDATLPAADTVVSGGGLQARYQVAGKDHTWISIRPKLAIGKSPCISLTVVDKDNNYIPFQLGGQEYAGGPVPLEGVTLTWPEAVSAGWITKVNPNLASQVPNTEYNNAQECYVTVYPNRIEVIGQLRVSNPQTMWFNAKDKLYAIGRVPKNKTNVVKPSCSGNHLSGFASGVAQWGFTRPQKGINNQTEWACEMIAGKTNTATTIAIHDVWYFI